MGFTTKLRLNKEKAEQLSGNTLNLSGTTKIQNSGILRYESEHRTITDNQHMADKQYVDDNILNITGDTGILVFQDNITVSIDDGKTFGRYVNNDTIPASGKTPNEVIKMALNEPMNPDVTLNHNLVGSTLDYGEENKEVEVTFNYDIKSQNADVDEFTLEWRRGTSGLWTLISTNPQLPSPYMLSVDDTENGFNTTVIQLKLTVKDTIGMETIRTHNVYPPGFSAGSMNITVHDEDDQVNFLRKKGNIVSKISGSNDANNQQYNTVTEYVIERSVDGGNYTIIETTTDLNTNNVTVDQKFDENTINTANNVRYRITFTYIDSNTSSVESSLIKFRSMSYYGSNSSAKLEGTDVLTLENGEFLTSREREINITVNEGEYGYIAYPYSFGELTVIRVPGAENQIEAWESELPSPYTTQVTNSYGGVEEYIVYRTSGTQAYTDEDLELE